MRELSVFNSVGSLSYMYVLTGGCYRLVLAVLTLSNDLSFIIGGTVTGSYIVIVIKLGNSGFIFIP